MGKFSVKIRHWRRFRRPIPASLRRKLPLGTRVKVKLRIKATPRRNTGCAGTVSHRTLHVRVVKVIPRAIQSKRAH